MTAIEHAIRPVPMPRPGVLRSDPAAQAFVILRAAFVLAPILFGIDKYANVLTSDWTRYLAPEYLSLFPGSAAAAMHVVGIVEILAGLIVLVSPRIGGLVVAAWLAGIIGSLLLVGGYGDIALRDFGLLLAALALSRLANADFGGSRADGGARR